MPNLIPEKRLDKNGVLTTKHVRATPRTPAMRRTPPAPTLAASSKGLKLRPAQTQQREQFFSSFTYDARRSMEARRTGDRDYQFTASDTEVYDVLSVTHGGNALVLLALGIRSADDARAYLLKNGEGDLLTDNSELVQEMLKRNISPQYYLENTNTSAGTVRFDSPFLADAIEFSTIKSLEDSFHRSETRALILDGEITLADIKTIGASRLKNFDRLRGISDTLRDYHKGNLDCSIEDIKDFVTRANDEGLVLGHFKSAVHLLRNFDREKMDEVKDLRTFAAIFNPKVKDLKAEAHRAHYASLLMDGLAAAEVPRSARYFGAEFPKDVETLRSAGIEAKDAYPLMNDGMTAQQVVGVLNGVNVAVSEGWL